MAYRTNCKVSGAMHSFCRTVARASKFRTAFFLVALHCQVCALAKKEPSYYDILGVSKSAKQSHIKQAYRRMAVKWHPDKNPDNKEEATKKFREVAEAYEVLGDPQKREKYDTFGKSDASDFGSGFNPNDIFEQFFKSSGFSFNFGDMESFFKAFGGGGGSGDEVGPSMPGVDFDVGDDIDDIVKVIPPEWDGLSAPDGRSTAVLFIDSEEIPADDAEADKFGDIWERAAVKWGKVGLLDVAVYDCAVYRMPNACTNALGKKYDPTLLPRIAYYVPWSTKPDFINANRQTITYPLVSKWFDTVVPNTCEDLSTLEQMQAWLTNGTAQHGAYIILITAKKVVPPLVKALAIEFRINVKVGVVLGSADPDVADKFGVMKKPVVLRIDDVASLKFTKFEGELKKGPLVNFFMEAMREAELMEAMKEHTEL